jgi:hypothetical protein
MLNLPDIDRNLVKRALTLPACGTGEDYESLETVVSAFAWAEGFRWRAWKGDSFLKVSHSMAVISLLKEDQLATSVHAFMQCEFIGRPTLSSLTEDAPILIDPDSAEGVLAQMREHSTDSTPWQYVFWRLTVGVDETLKRSALHFDLASHIISERWRTAPWIPSSSECVLRTIVTDCLEVLTCRDCVLIDSGSLLRRNVPQKALSDCIEALLGAGWCGGGLKRALEVGTALGLCFGGTELWHMRPIPPRPLKAGNNYKSFEPLEQRLGYVFKDKTLLVEACARSFLLRFTDILLGWPIAHATSSARCLLLTSALSRFLSVWLTSLISFLQVLGRCFGRREPFAEAMPALLEPRVSQMYVVAHFMKRYKPEEITSEQISRLKVICV